MSESKTNNPQENSIGKSRIKNNLKIIGKILSVLSIVFIVLKIFRMDFDLSVIDNIPLLLAAAFAALISKIISVYTSSRAWGVWISFFSQKKIPGKEVFVIYGKAGIGKYLPGNVMHYVGRNLFAAQYGLSQKKIAASSVFEIGELIFSSVVLSLLLLPSDYRMRALSAVNDNEHSLIIPCAAFAILLIAVIIFLLLKKGKVAGYIKRFMSFDLISTAFKSFAGYIATFILLGSGLVFLWMSIYKLFPDAELIRILISSFSIAWVCGFMIPGASGGIGIREAILTVLLEEYAEGSILIFMIIAHRLITIIGDFAAYGLALIIEKKSHVV